MTLLPAISATVTFTDRREILHDGIYRSRQVFSPFGGSAPGNPQIRNFGPTF